MPGLTGHLLQLPGKMCNFAGYMKKHILLTILAVAALAACEQSGKVQKRPTGLVQSILADSTGLRDIAGYAGQIGSRGSITLFGESRDVKPLAQRFKDVDLMDNVDGREKRDSLPDFAGEIIAGLLADSIAFDNLREAAVYGALQAWDTTLRKESAKILIYPSSLQAAYGFHDVDTLQQLTGGQCHLLSPVSLLVDKAFEKATNVVVWTSDTVKKAKVWEQALAQSDRPGKSLAVYSPDASLDVPGQFREILTQYQVTGLLLDGIIVDSYQIDLSTLEAELQTIRAAANEEDANLNRMLSAQFKFYEPADALIRATYSILRKENLFAHRIARPVVKYYEYVPELY